MIAETRGIHYVHPPFKDEQQPLENICVFYEKNIIIENFPFFASVLKAYRHTKHIYLFDDMATPWPVISVGTNELFG